MKYGHGCEAREYRDFSNLNILGSNQRRYRQLIKSTWHSIFLFNKNKDYIKRVLNLTRKTQDFGVESNILIKLNSSTSHSYS